MKVIYYWLWWVWACSESPMAFRGGEESLTILLNVNKAHGPGNISGGMIELCENSIALPLSIKFNNIINTGIFSAIWKSANVTPVHKKRK